jgi:hypothetical protein
MLSTCCCSSFSWWQALRPDELTPEQAVVALLDARSILRDMQVCV